MPLSEAENFGAAQELGTELKEKCSLPGRERKPERDGEKVFLPQKERPNQERGRLCASPDPAGTGIHQRSI